MHSAEGLYSTSKAATHQITTKLETYIMRVQLVGNLASVIYGHL